MSGSITFVGAGPGAADLITVRGKRVLDAADVVIYAGSLVDERLLDGSRAEKYNSAGMDFDAVMDVMIQAWNEGKQVVRLHTGDPAMYGAVGEQFRALDERGIPYEVVPGVSSVFAAAAALGASHAKAWGWSLALAILLALSRLYLYVHYPTDILAGALVGTLAGLAGAALAKRLPPRRAKKEQLDVAD